MNVAEEILRPGDDASPAIRVHGDARRLTVGRGELRRSVRQAAAAFARLGVQEEQRVLVALPDCPEAVYAVLGAIWNGSVPVPVELVSLGRCLRGVPRREPGPRRRDDGDPSPRRSGGAARRS